MKKKASNIINKLLIDLNIPSAEEPRRNHLSQQVKSAIVSGVEAFDKNLSARFHSGSYRVDQLVIDISVEKTNVDNLESEVKKKLTEAVLAAKSSGAKSTQAEAVFQVKNISQKKKNEDLLTHFLMNGTFPWWAGSSTSVRRLDDLLNTVSEKVWKQRYLPELKKNPRSVWRLVNQFSEETIQRIIGLTEDSGDDFSSVFQLSENFITFIRGFSSELPFGFVETFKTSFYRNIISELIHSGSAKKSVRRQRIFSEISRLIINSLPDNLFQKWITYLKRSKSVKEDVLEILTDISVPDKPILPTAADGTGLTEPEEAAGLDVKTAGLVLLHPFIAMLFDKVGYLENGLFRSQAVMERAVCLLHYLATGEEEFPEPSLALPMHLCSWTAGEPVNRFLLLSSYEKDECRQLLASAITHWAALKNTSPEGLQVNFIQRAGRLKKAEFGWTLFVETKAQDILLDALPWGISALKFKWMDELLTIQWRTG